MLSRVTTNVVMASSLDSQEHQAIPTDENIPDGPIPLIFLVSQNPMLDAWLQLASQHDPTVRRGTTSHSKADFSSQER